LIASQSNAALKPTRGAGGVVIDSDRLVAPATGFPTGNNPLGAVVIVDYAAVQPSIYPVAFGYSSSTNNRFLFYCITNTPAIQLAISSSGIAVIPATVLGATVSAWGVYLSSTALTYRNGTDSEGTSTTLGAANFSGSVYLGDDIFYSGATSSKVTLRQLAWVTSVADARIMHAFLRALEGL
jgi:hypothetical protein